ncbi:MAG: hypothetical protein HYS22_07400 [Deltaproteobacteria bacterium]|nr:hypothetical protein [Deltaproteobacteria bacterium]
MRKISFSLLVSFWILIFIPGCVEFLTGAGSRVSIIRSEAIRPFCQALQRARLNDSANEVRNAGAKVGANYVAIEGKPSLEEVDVVMVNCPALVQMTDDEVKSKCEAKGSNACIELAYRSGNDDKLLLKNLQKACSLKNDAACQLVVQAKENIQMAKNKEQHERRLAKAVINCDKGNSKDCLIVAAAYNQTGDYDVAIRMAERACSLGNKGGCLMQSNFINQQQQRQQFLLQAIMIQNQNAAAVQSQLLQQQQLINASVTQMQNQVLQNTVVPQTTKCKGLIHESGRFSATCN